MSVGLVGKRRVSFSARSVAVVRIQSEAWVSPYCAAALAGTGSGPKKNRRVRIAFFFASGFVGLSLCTPAWCEAQRANSTEAEQCLAFIMTSRPGGDASVPYGGVFQTLSDAQQDALNRCSLTNLAQEGWGPCRTWCVKAN
jgi:hypothetical protein